MEAALKCVQPRDLLLIQADVIDETVEYIKRYLAVQEDGREIDLLKAIEVPTAGPSIPAARCLPARSWTEAEGFTVPQARRAGNSPSWLQGPRRLPATMI